jgi:hypothetical protein
MNDFENTGGRLLLRISVSGGASTTHTGTTLPLGMCSALGTTSVGL